MDRIDGTIKQFPYRTAMVGGVVLELPRQALAELEAQLAKKAGVRVDNHTVYELVQVDRPAAYLMFTDFTVRFGTSVEERAW